MNTLLGQLVIKNFVVEYIPRSCYIEVIKGEEKIRYAYFDYLGECWWQRQYSNGVWSGFISQKNIFAAICGNFGIME